MRIKLKWRRHAQHPSNVIAGQTSDLPDNKCWYVIAKLKDGTYSISLPALKIDDYFRVMILRDAEVAREFCEDDLNYNLIHIIKHQIKEMRNTSQIPIKSPAHYEMLLQKYSKLIEENKTPPKVAA